MDPYYSIPDENLLLSPMPSAPVFTETIEQKRLLLAKKIGLVKVSKIQHPLLERHLEKTLKRCQRNKYHPSVIAGFYKINGESEDWES